MSKVDPKELASGKGEHARGAPDRQLLTVLFVDVAGSTERLVEVGDRRWRETLRRHHEASSQSVREYGGRVVNVTGDGMLSVFPTPASALHCAPRLLAAALELELDLRAGIHTGECEVWEGEVAGLTVHTGARIAALADPGEILVSSTVQALVAGSDLRFVERGTYWLKGVPGEWRVLAMTDLGAPAVEEANPPDTTAPSELAMPSRLALFAGQPFVGRESERGQLRSAITSIRGGGQETVFVAGEPGIGKTRLAAAVCEEARTSGCGVLYGRCDEDLGLPMQPLVEALEHLVENAPSSLLRRHVAERGGELALLVPSLARRVPALPVPRAGQEEENRWVLVNALAGLLAATAAGRGLVLVLDDLHWADQTTILVLRHMILSHALPGVAMVGTYRDTEMADEHPLAALLADVSSEPGVSRVALGGLDQADVALLLEGLGAGAPGETREALSRVLREETDGNPLFVVELLRALDDAGELHRSAEGWIASRSIVTTALPGTVREAIVRRVRRLDPGVLAALSTASVIGREFDFELLRTVCGVDENELLETLEAAVGAHLLQEVPSREVRFTFTHALIEYTLYGELSLARRQRLHRRVAEGIEQGPDAEIERRAGELAYHWAESSAVGGAKALHFAEAAGEQALAQLAFAEAVGWFRRALEIVERQPAAPDLRARELERAELLLRLGGAQRRAGDPECRATLLAAGEMARRLGETEMLVAAALAKTRGVASQMGRVDDEQVRALDTALQAVGERDSRERAELLSMLSIELLFDGDHVQRWARSDEALAIARRVGDHSSLMRVLTERAWAINAPDTLTERLANLDEVVEVHGQEHDLMLVLAIRARADARLEASDVTGMEADVVRCELEAAALLEPLASWWAMCPRLQLTMLHGRLADCERLAQEYLQLGMRAGQPDALTFFAAVLVGLRRQQGRMGEMRAVYEQAVAENPTMPAWSGGLALAHVAEGDCERALGLLRAAAADRFAHMPRDWVWLVGVCQWAETAALLEEREACECLYELLLPWRERVITTGTAAWGTVAHHLCLLAMVLGLDRESDEHLREAASLHARVGAPVWLAATHVTRARMLLGREGERAAARCGEDLRSALLAARTAGAAGVEHNALDLMARLGVDAGDLSESASR